MGEGSGDHTHSSRARALGSPGLSLLSTRPCQLQDSGSLLPAFLGRITRPRQRTRESLQQGPRNQCPGSCPWLCTPRPWVGRPPELNHGRPTPTILSLDPGRRRERLPRVSRGGPHHPPLTGAWPGERTRTGILGPGQRWGPPGAVLTEVSVKPVPSSHSSSPPSDHLNFITSVSDLG